MHRSEITIDLGAVRRNTRRLREALGASELWAVVKADGYGHGAVDVAGAVLAEGAAALCVATVAEAVELRREFTQARILVMGPTVGRELATAREAGLELTVWETDIPEDVPVHVKLDTGMGRWGLATLREVPELPPNVVGLMTHLATADSDPAFAHEQLRRFEAATRDHSRLTRHAANSAAALRIPESRLDASRCGIALYGLSPFGVEPAEDGLEPVLRWESRLAQVKQLAAGETTGYGRRFVARDATYIGVVPVGYADGFRRDMTGTDVLVEGERRRVVGTISMDALAVELPHRLPVGTPVTLIGDGVLAEHHAAVAGTINYEIVSRIDAGPRRARRTVVDA
jgi:alanine racemase